MVVAAGLRGHNRGGGGVLPCSPWLSVCLYVVFSLSLCLFLSDAAGLAQVVGQAFHAPGGGLGWQCWMIIVGAGLAVLTCPLCILC